MVNSLIVFDLLLKKQILNSMALKFLTKKKWHVRRLENIRKYAEAEAKQAEEQTRMAELRREREEEREFENIRRIQEASGRIPKQQPRLEFIYKAPSIKKQTEEEIVTAEQILAEKRTDSILFNKLDKKTVELQVPGVKWLRDMERGKNEVNLKLREDPMTSIMAKRKKMKKEQEEHEEMLRQLRAFEEASMIRKPSPSPQQIKMNEAIQSKPSQIDAVSKSSTPVQSRANDEQESSDSNDYSESRRHKHRKHRHHHRHHRHHKQSSSSSDSY